MNDQQQSRADAPMKRSDRVEKTMRELHSAFIDCTIHAQDAFALHAYVVNLERRCELAASTAERPAAAPADGACKRCGSTTAQACNDVGCFYLESGDGEPLAAPADERASGMPDEVRDSMMDSQYLAGVTAGWNAANADDPNAALKKIHDAYSGYLNPLRDWQKAGRPGAPATPAMADERAECIAWAIANGFTKYHESMCAAWEERARRAAASAAPADERAVSFEAWCDRFPEISAVERLRDAWQEARAAASPTAEVVATVEVGSMEHGPFTFQTTPYGADTLPKGTHSLYAAPQTDHAGAASPAAERVTAALQALSADVHTLGDGWANDEAMIGLAKKYLRVEPKPASPELSLWRDFVLLAVTDAAPQPAQADAPAEAHCDGSGAVPVSVDDWSECPVCHGAGCQPEPRGHQWDEDGERCVKCGDKDWMAGKSCSESLVNHCAADAPVRIEALRKGLFEARDAMRVMSNWAKKPDPAGHSWAVRMVDRANAVLNGEADAAQADAPAEAREPHFDDVAVDWFSAVMKHKLALARDKGRGGWETCSPADLSRMLREHVEKGDPRDVANFCMMLWHHGSPIVSAPADAAEAREAVANYVMPPVTLLEQHKRMIAERHFKGAPDVCKALQCIDDVCVEMLSRAPADAGEAVAIVRRQPNGAIAMFAPDGKPFDMSAFVGATFYTAPPAARVASLTDEQREAVEWAAGYAYSQAKPFDGGPESTNQRRWRILCALLNGADHDR